MLSAAYVVVVIVVSNRSRAIKSKDERERIQLDRVLRHTDDDELPAGCKTRQKRPHSSTTRACCENRFGPAHALQYRSDILVSSIDVNVCAQISCKLFLLASTPNCDRPEAHVPRKLDTKMPETANALHSDQISTAQAGVAKSVVGRNAGAKERSGFYRCELIRNGSDGARFCDHRFRISSIHGYSRHHGVLTIHDIPASARFAHPVFAGDQANTDSLTDRSHMLFHNNIGNRLVP